MSDEYDIQLVDDGTTDTVFRIKRRDDDNLFAREIRFSPGYVAMLQAKSGDVTTPEIQALIEDAIGEYKELIREEFGWDISCA